VPQVNIIAARHAWLTRAFVLLADNLRHTRTTRRGVPLLTPGAANPSLDFSSTGTPACAPSNHHRSSSCLTHTRFRSFSRQSAADANHTPSRTPTNAVATNPSLDFSSTGIPACAPSKHHRSSSCLAHTRFRSFSRQSAADANHTPCRTPTNARAASPMRPECDAEEPARQCDRRYDRR
jgi:hypothetical protein